MTPTQPKPMPWREPGYTGRIKPTPWLSFQPNYTLPAIPQDEQVDTVYELFAMDMINETQLNQLIAQSYADDSPAEGHRD